MPLGQISKYLVLYMALKILNYPETASPKNFTAEQGTVQSQIVLGSSENPTHHVS